MSDERLRLNLRAVERPVQPNASFTENLHDRLATELGFGAPLQPQPMSRPARPQVRRRGRVGWLAVAALLALALMALLLGQSGRTPEPSPSGSPPPSGSLAPSGSPSFSPAPSPSTQPPSAVPESSPALDNLRGGGLVVYEADAMSGLPRLRVLQPDLSSVELLPDVPSAQFEAAWRPDGQRLAYTGFDPAALRSPLRIWETDAEGADPVLVSQGCDLPACVAEYEPSYSPDGASLAFVRTSLREGAAEESVVAVRDLETGAVTELEATRRPRAQEENLHPRWSPDGQTIAYGVTEYDESGFPGGSTLHLVDADGTNDRTISSPDLYAGEPEWSRDGQTILFAANPFRPTLRAVGSALDASHRLGVMDADGANVRLFDFGRVMVGGTWTATGEQILFTLMEGSGVGVQRPFNPRLFVMDADGGNVLAVSPDPGDALYGVQQPVP